MKKVCTVKEAAEMLSLHPHTIRRLCERGELKARAIRGPGGQIRKYIIPLKAIDEWLDAPPEPKKQITVKGARKGASISF